MKIYIQGFGEFDVSLDEVSIDEILAELESQGVYLPKQDWEVEEEGDYVLLY